MLQELIKHSQAKRRGREWGLREMAKTVTGIEAALMEAAGHGALAVVGRSIVFKSGSLVTTWSHCTAKEAATILKVLRAAPKHFQGAQNV